MGCLCSSGCCRGGVGWGSTIISWKFFFSLFGVGSLHHSSILPAGAVVVVAWWVVGCLRGFRGYFTFDLVLFFFLFCLFLLPLRCLEEKALTFLMILKKL